MVQILLTLAYPAIVYVALQVVSPRAVGVAVLALLALRLAVLAPRRLALYARLGLPLVVAAAAASAVTLVWNDPRALLLTPALANLAFLAAFALSFASRETLVETLALAQVGTLSPEEHAYCRKLTGLWCVFFLVNAAVTARLALYGTLESWALYTGLIAYVLMGTLFAGEFIYRHWRFRRYVGLPTDPFLRRLFPPKDAR